MENGLACVFGAAAQPVGLRSPERQWDKLKRLEREAKQLKVGAWGAASGRMAARTQKVQPKSCPDSFDAFSTLKNWRPQIEQQKERLTHHHRRSRLR